MNIIVTGATGYIGSKLTVLLKQQGHSVIAFSRTENTILKELNVDFKIVDITKPFSDISIPNVDAFIHLAAANDVDCKDSFSALNINSFGTKNSLDFCIQNKIQKFIYFSTFQVYGELNKSIDDSTQPSPNNDYGLTHLFAEEYVKMYHQTKNIDYIILRPTNIYGAPLSKHIDRWSLVPGCFCKEALENGTITLLSSGLQKRDFINLNDLIKYTSYSLNYFNELKNKAVNFSSGKQYSIIDIAKMVKNCIRNKFNREIEILVKSGDPTESNVFTIDRDVLEKSDFVFSDSLSFINEINSTLEILL
jgi:UDP-glucose 4-epimerase